ncbi:BOLA4 protein [Nymphaea thermarum]|nr:BOLA4 protein [Nymphaea thermarum]
MMNSVGDDSSNMNQKTNTQPKTPELHGGRYTVVEATAAEARDGEIRPSPMSASRHGYAASLAIIDVVSAAFEGQSAVNRQRMVYKAIWEELQTTVHAVDQMTTKTPEEAAASSG